MTAQAKAKTRKASAPKRDASKADAIKTSAAKAGINDAGKKPRASKPAAAKSVAKATSTETTDKRRSKGAASSQRMIDAAIDLIAKEGIANVTMQRIATAVGGSTALVVFHFRNMENLYLAVLEHLNALYDAMWELHVDAPGLTAAQRLSGAVDCAYSFMKRYPEGVSVFIAFSSDRKNVQFYRKITLPGDRANLAIGRKLVDQIAAEGGYKGLDLDAVSESIHYLIYGSWLWDQVTHKAGRIPNLQTCALLLLERVFPKHFPLR